MDNLEKLRKEIDGIDTELAQLVKRRLEIAGKVAETKTATGGAVLDPARERAVLNRVADIAGSEFENGVCLLFSTLMGISRARQRAIMRGEPALVAKIREACASTPNVFPSRAIVACPGTEGGYAQQAASSFFHLPTIMYFRSFENIFDAVEQGLCPYGVLPIENSAAGSVAAVYDLMDTHRFHIVKALRMKVDHVLLAKPGTRLEDVKEISSHPHALAQCTAFLKKHPSIRTLPDTNTACAAKELASSGAKNRAVIASRACAELYGLEIVKEGIMDAVYNYTRFICIAKKCEIYPDAKKFSIMLSLPHRPGSLNGIISRFASIGVNLTKLESRPVPGLDFEFRFTFDFEASPREEAVLGLLAELANDPQIEHFTFLGAYPEA